MDMAIISGIFLGSAGIVALLILLMTFDKDYLKKLAIMAAVMFVSPLLITLVGNSLAWFDLQLIEIITLRQGALSILIAAAYGVIAGVILNYIKIEIATLWRNRVKLEK
ncbi:hypothetical protein Ga0123462_1400 [Mariprofundus ferrinatatus]|uniref:Uncharacterized protein n=1 Tax=Mariprofundus ferrinatatus TaxID=1921087 RepID=A0A2K8L4U9_9PROT|nr:hypothetical protein [Mariprofundus ferrinatatus]ATX82263.1 hypothetical protein Ga0123462_1400 [Mariprofundus ferrinatatus]